MLFRRTLLASLLALPFGLAQAAAVVGQPAPAFSVRDSTGQEVKLSQFRGKHVVLEWMNPGCSFVRKHYESGNMAATQKEALAKGVVWLSLHSTDDDSWGYTKPGKLQEWVRARSAAPTALLIDGNGAVGKAYGARTPSAEICRSKPRKPSSPLGRFELADELSRIDDELFVRFVFFRSPGALQKEPQEVYSVRVFADGAAHFGAGPDPDHFEWDDDRDTWIARNMLRLAYELAVAGTPPRG